MRMYSVIAAIAFLLGSGGATHAAQIVSPPLPTSENTAGACYFRNVGTTPITLQVDTWLNFSPGFISPSFQNCNQAPLPGGRTCVVLVDDLPDDVTFACSAVVSSATNLRGIAEVRQITNGGLRVVVSEELR